MSTRILVPLLLLLTAIGGLSLYLMDSGGERGDRGASAAPAQSDTGLVGESEAANLEPSTSIGNQTITNTAAPSEARTVVAAAPSDSLDEEVSAEPDSDEQATVSGRVVDVRGRPIEGATITAGASVFEITSHENLDGEGEGFGRVTTTTSGVDGKFELAGVKAGTPTFRIRAVEFAPLTHKAVGIAANETFAFPEQFVLEDSAIIAGVVLDANGVPVAGARIRTQAQSDGAFGFSFVFAGRGGITTADDGTFQLTQLDRDELDLVVTHDAHARHKVTIDAREARVLPSLEIRLPRGFSISGRVTGVPVDEAAELVIVAEPQMEDFGADFELRNATVDADGRFELLGVREGTRWELSAMRKPENQTRRGLYYPDADSRVTAKHETNAGDRNVELTWDGGVTLSFVVIDAKTQAPIEELEVRHGFGWLGNFPGQDSAEEESRYPGGVVTVKNLRTYGDASDFQLEVDALGYQKWKRDDIELVQGVDLDLGTIVLTPVAAVHVTVLDQSTGRPIAGAQVQLKAKNVASNDGGSMSGAVSYGVSMDASSDDDEMLTSFMLGDDANSHKAVTNEDGLAVLDSFEGRTCIVSVTAKDYAPGYVTGWVLPEGEVAITTVQLGLGGTAAVYAVDADGLPLSARKIEHKEPNADEMRSPMAFFGSGDKDRVTDKDGRVHFANLTPGTHRFRLAKAENRAGSAITMFISDAAEGSAGGDDDSWTSIEIVADEESELTLQEAPVGSLSGRVTEAGEPLRSARLSLKKIKLPSSGKLSPMEQAMQGVMFMGGGGPSAKTDRKGNYTFDGLEPGNYTLTVRHKDRSMPYERELTVLTSQQTQDLDLPLAILAGRVTDASGDGIEGLVVSVDKAADESEEGNGGVQVSMVVGGLGGIMGMGGAGAQSIKTQADGSYELRGVQTNVDLVVTVDGSENGYQSAESETVQVGGDEREDDIDLVVERGGTVDVVVKKADGSSADFVRVTLTPVGFEAETRNEFMMNGFGTVSGLKPGQWTVSSSAGPSGGPGTSRNDDPVETVVEVRAGESVPAELTLAN